MGSDDLPDNLSDDEEPKVKIHPPIFKGTPGERPDAHIYAAEDWMGAMRVRRDDYIVKFKHTLNHLAREWYHSLDLGQFRGDWDRFTTHFSRYFSTQGRNIKHLHERWRTFSFDPANDDIEEYIRDVKEAAKQLGHGDDAVVNLLKATMPTELYGTLYGHNNLPLLCTMLKDIYARKPQAAASSTTTTPGASAPFTMIKASSRTPELTLEDKLTHLMDTLYRMDIDSNRNSYIAIMDNLMLDGLKDNHMDLFKNLLVPLIVHGLKLSPRKCQLFMKHLVYLGNVFHIEDGVITITPMKSRIEAIQRLEHPTTVKGCKSFCGVVNYLSLFCKDLQKILKPIYELTRKEQPFVWTEFHQKAFEHVKELLVKPPVLHLPGPGGRFILYCDTSKTHTGSSLWQMQDGKPRLLGFNSKSLPDACQNYSVTELEMTGLVINIHLWKHLLLRVEFDCAVDHRALPYIMKSKNLPATGRIIRLLEHLSGYSFNLYYVKGKDMILCDYLSRIAVDDGNPDEVIPISFNALAQYRLAMDYITESFLIAHFNVATRSSTSAAGISLPPLHGTQKGLDPDLKPEKQWKSKKALLKPTIATPVKSPAATPGKSTRPIVNAPTVARTPTVSRNNPRSLINTPLVNRIPSIMKTPLSHTSSAQTQNQQTPLRPQTLVKTPISPVQTAGRKLIQRSVRLLNTPPHTIPIKLPSDTQTPVARPPIQLPPLEVPLQELDIPMPKVNPSIQPLPPQQCLLPQNNPFDIGSDLIPFQDREVEAIFKSPKMDYFLLHPTLGDQISDNTLLHRHLPRQSDIDRIMAQINRKYLTKL